MRQPRSRNTSKNSGRLIVSCLALLAVILAACARTPTLPAPPVSLTLSGSTDMSPLLTLLAGRFQERHPSVTVLLEGENSYLGAERVMNGSAALGAMSALPSDALWSAPIAVDGVAIVVHADNPLQNLTLSQVHDIFGGQTWHWSDLDIELPKDEIVVVSREQGSGTRRVFESLAMTQGQTLGPGSQPTPVRRTDGAGSTDVQSPTQWFDSALPAGDPVTSMAVLIPGSEAIVTYIATHPNAIGYVSRGYLRDQDPQGERVKTVRVEDIPPTLEQIAGQRYHLVQPLFLVAPREPTGVARQFVDFCLSAEGQALTAQQYVPVRP